MNQLILNKFLKQNVEPSVAESKKLVPIITGIDFESDELVKTTLSNIQSAPGSQFRNGNHNANEKRLLVKLLKATNLTS
jgi:hypothetical protein